MTRHELDRRQILRGTVIIGAAGALSALGDPTAALAKEEKPKSLVGAWLETISATDNAFPPFQTLFTYDTEGGLVGTGSIDLNPETLSSPTFGAWARAGDGAYRWTGRAFSSDAQGNPNGMYIIDESVTLDKVGDSYKGAGTFKIVFNGAITVSGAYVATATRIML